MRKIGILLLALFSIGVLGSCATVAQSEQSNAAATQAQSDNKAGQQSGHQEKQPAVAASAKKLQPFAQIIEGADRLEGFISLYRKDEKVWLELAPEDFGRRFYLKSNLDRGIGENRIYGGMMVYPMGVHGIVQFRRVGDNVQMLMKNAQYTAHPNTPEAQAVARSFSDSLLASAPVVSQPHPERKTVLVEANALLLADIPGAADILGRIYRQSYAFDARNRSLVVVEESAGHLRNHHTAHTAGHAADTQTRRGAAAASGSGNTTDIADRTARCAQHVFGLQLFVGAVAGNSDDRARRR